MSDADVTLLIVSQVRDKIGAMFGAKHTRTGGRALDFYASQVLDARTPWAHRENDHAVSNEPRA
jgi:recombination protein RecA